MLFWDENRKTVAKHPEPFEKISSLLDRLIAGKELPEFGGMWKSLNDKYNKGEDIQQVIEDIYKYLAILQVSDNGELKSIICYIKPAIPEIILEDYIKYYLESKNTNLVKKGLMAMRILLNYNLDWEHGRNMYWRAYIDYLYKLNNERALDAFLQLVNTLTPKNALHLLRDAIDNPNTFTFRNAKAQLREQYIKVEDCYTASLFKQNNEEALNEFLDHVKGLPVEQANFLIIKILAEQNAFIWAKNRIYSIYNEMNLRPSPLACTI